MACLGISSLGLSFVPTCLGGSPGPVWRDVEVRVVNEDGTFQQEVFYRWPNRDGDFVGAFYDRHLFPIHPREYAPDPINRHEHRIERLREDGRVFETVTGNRIMHFREHIPSGDLYDRGKTGNPTTIAAKSFFILYGSVPYTAGMMVMNLVAAAVHTFVVVKEAFFAASENGFCAGCRTLATGLYERVGSDLFIVVMSPIYMLGFQAGAIVGLISQDDGMRIMDKVERAWHRGASYRDAYQYSERLESGEDEENDCFEVIMNKTYIMAWCLLRRGNRADQIAGPDGPIARYAFV